MLRNLDNALRAKGISRNLYAETLEISPKTAWAKINGESELTLRECRRTCILLPEYRADYLFAEAPSNKEA